MVRKIGTCGSGSVNTSIANMLLLSHFRQLRSRSMSLKNNLCQISCYRTRGQRCRWFKYDRTFLGRVDFDAKDTGISTGFSTSLTQFIAFITSLPVTSRERFITSGERVVVTERRVRTRFARKKMTRLKKKRSSFIGRDTCSNFDNSIGINERRWQ